MADNGVVAGGRLTDWVSLGVLAGVMTGYHTRWARLKVQADDPERIAIREALVFGKALYDRRAALGLSVADLAQRAGMTIDEIECIEEGGTEPTVALLRRLAAALDADVRLTSGHDLGSVGFETHAACAHASKHAAGRSSGDQGAGAA